MRLHRRAPILALSALLVALSLAFTRTASAQTSFQASATWAGTRPAGRCSNGAYICGTANIADYGAATWNFYTTSGTGVFSPCGSTYTATTYFTLVSDPGSTLVLDESGSLCGLGHDGAARQLHPAGPPFGLAQVVVGPRFPSQEEEANLGVVTPRRTARMRVDRT
jgi:hypothetical protein